MHALLRTLRMLCLVVWVGGIIFFAFVLAPVAFHLLPSRHMAGIVVGGTLRVLDVIGIVCGIIFCAATALLLRQSQPRAKLRSIAQILIAAVMLLATAYLHGHLLPAMERDRSAVGGNIESAPDTDAAKIHFERLHQRSERIEGAVLLCGLGIVILMANEALPARQDKIGIR